jgi:hypothetical protein
MATLFHVPQPNGVTKEPFNPELDPIIDIHFGASFIKANNTMPFGEYV